MAVHLHEKRYSYPSPIHVQFEEGLRERWLAGEVTGWEDRGLGPAAAVAAGGASTSGLDLEAFDSVEELEALGEPDPVSDP